MGDGIKDRTLYWAIVVADQLLSEVFGHLYTDLTLVTNEKTTRTTSLSLH